MTTFKQASQNFTNTTNGMIAFKSTTNYCLDLFFNIGASRGKNIIEQFDNAYDENPDLAIRIALWTRDIRGGSGERQLFRDILSHMSVKNVQIAKAMVQKIPEIGRWDDIFSATGEARLFGFELIKNALNDSNGLCAKWMPRKGNDAISLREYLNLTPKAYRKLIVNLTKVVENKMCKKEWNKIEYNHVPSVASARYQKAFNKNDTVRYMEYKNKLLKNETKVNASAVYPYDVLKSIRFGDMQVADAQWKALPDYIGDQRILPLVDVSGSMTRSVGENKNLSCMDVAVSLGLYISDRNKGVFKDTFLTFSSNPEIITVSGSLSEKYNQMVRSSWRMSTNIEKAFHKILNVGKSHNLSNDEMPEYLLILSDMQFDMAIDDKLSSFDLVKKLYNESEYELPKIVFWNLHAAYSNFPVTKNQNGVALVSGFNPSLMKTVLSGKEFNPIDIMNDTIYIERYNY